MEPETSLCLLSNHRLKSSAAKADDPVRGAPSTNPNVRKFWLPRWSPSSGAPMAKPMGHDGSQWLEEAKPLYFIAPKRLSNEFDETIGADPATWLSLVAGAGAAAAVSVTDGFSGGRLAVCLASAFGAGAFGTAAS